MVAAAELRAPRVDCRGKGLAFPSKDLILSLSKDEVRLIDRLLRCLSNTR
jgi:DUF917 family protein